MESQDHFADADLVPILQFCPALNLVAVDHRAIPAAEVFQKIGAMAFENLGVVTADGRIVEHDLTRGVTPHHHPIARQFDNLAGATPLDDFQYRHGELSDLPAKVGGSGV
jgi:hypothetical protein